MPEILLRPLDDAAMAKAQRLVTAHHYLHRPVDPRTSPEGYTVHLRGLGNGDEVAAHTIGVLIFGRPEATVCRPFYGSLADLAAGRVEMSRWSVLNLSRVWLDPLVQAGGGLYLSWLLPGFRDRKGHWHSTLASTVIRSVLSYCDPKVHKGTIYRAAGFRLERTNGRGLQTWRIDLPLPNGKGALTTAQDAHVRHIAEQHPRSRLFRARRADRGAGVQLSLEAA